jgi:hypothetical protein
LSDEGPGTIAVAEALPRELNSGTTVRTGSRTIGEDPVEDTGIGEQGTAVRLAVTLSRDQFAKRAEHFKLPTNAGLMIDDSERKRGRGPVRGPDHRGNGETQHGSRGMWLKSSWACVERSGDRYSS